MEQGAAEVRFRTLTVIWFGLLGGVVFFGVASLLLISGVVTGESWSPFLEARLAVPLLALPLLLLFSGLLARRRLAASAAAKGDEEARWQAYQTGVVVSGAIQEGGGLLGVVLCLGAALPGHLVGIVLLTALTMIMTRPRAEELPRRR